MKIASLLTGAAFCAAMAALPLASVTAHEGHDHGAAAPTAANATEAWANAQASLKAIKAAVPTKDADTIHTEQEKLAASLKQVQEKGNAADKARLDGAIKNAIAASERVHAAADAKDFGKVESGLRTLEATMQMVERNLATEK
ncbi:MAG TPA: hypothetical protein VF683_00540 [Chthoniobacterales bacterium]|jgi:hypothetical protein